jgi:hypothetical protein
MDVFVQNAIAEGDSMPIQEAKACGLPAIVTDHSATAEKGRYPAEYSHIESEENYTVHKGGMVFKNKALRHEPETSCFRAVPDIEDLSDKMYLLLTDDELRSKMSKQARECVEENYDWDKLYKQWEFVLDNARVPDRATTWESPIEPTVEIQPKEIPDGLSDLKFIEWLYIEILGYPQIDLDGAKMWQQHLDQGIARQALLHVDEDKLRNQIRSELIGVKPKETQEWI